MDIEPVTSLKQTALRALLWLFCLATASEHVRKAKQNGMTIAEKALFYKVFGLFAVANSVLPYSFSNHRPLCNLSRFSVTLTFDVDI